MGQIFTYVEDVHNNRRVGRAVVESKGWEMNGEKDGKNEWEERKDKKNGKNGIVLQLHHWRGRDAPAFSVSNISLNRGILNSYFLSLE